MRGRVWVMGALCAGLCVGPGGVFAEETLSERGAAAATLLESTDRHEQQLGFLRLEALREPAALPVVQRYAEHKDPELRAYGLRATAAIGGAASVPWLLERYNAERHPAVRRAILQALEPYQAASPDILPTYLRALRARSPEIRMAAVDIISRVDDQRARDGLRERMERERHRDVRRVLDAIAASSQDPGGG